jgi:hypothetical protein
MTWIAKHFPEATWRRAAREAAREYLANAVTGRGGSRGRHLPAAERLAALWAAAWYAAHRRWLDAKRADTIAAGQHDELYRARLEELYTPAPVRESLRG